MSTTEPLGRGRGVADRGALRTRADISAGHTAEPLAAAVTRRTARRHHHTA